MEEKDKEKQESLYDRCNVFGSDDVLTDDADIAYYLACIEEFSASNRLLGQIMHDGRYVISNEIKFDLVRLPKELTAQNDSVIEATARLTAKDMFFTIQIEEEEDSFVASLFLTENVSGYLNVKSIKSFIARIKQPKSDDFFDKCKKVFNVQKVVDAISEGEFINLATRIQDQIDYSLSLDDIDELSSQIYLLRMLELLENGGDQAKKVVEEYKSEIKVQKLDKSSAKHPHKQMRKILDEKIKQAGGEKVVLPEKRKEIRQIKQEYASTVEKLSEMKGKIIAREVPKPEEKAESKKPEAKASAKKADTKKSASKSAAGKPKSAKKSKAKPAAKSAGKSAGGGGGGKIAGKLPEAKPALKSPKPQMPSPPMPKPPKFKLVPLARKPIETNKLSKEIDLLDGGLGKETNVDDDITKTLEEGEIVIDEEVVLISVDVKIEKDVKVEKSEETEI